MEKARLKEIIRELGNKKCNETGTLRCTGGCQECMCLALGITENEHAEIFENPTLTDSQIELCRRGESKRCEEISFEECGKRECIECRMKGWNLSESEYEIIFNN